MSKNKGIKAKACPGMYKQRFFAIRGKIGGVLRTTVKRFNNWSIHPGNWLSISIVTLPTVHTVHHF